MKIFLTVLFGFLAGIIGGMGMGGGTLLVPLLSFLDIPQKSVQAINLIGFLPMCVGALIVHCANGLVKTHATGYLILPAVVASAVGALLTDATGNKLLKVFFGVFLICVGVWQLYVAIAYVVKTKRSLLVKENAPSQSDSCDPPSADAFPR